VPNLSHHFPVVVGAVVVTEVFVVVVFVVVVTTDVVVVVGVVFVPHEASIMDSTIRQQGKIHAIFFLILFCSLSLFIGIGLRYQPLNQLMIKQDPTSH
jgi:hypothetical protein